MTLHEPQVPRDIHDLGRIYVILRKAIEKLLECYDRHSISKGNVRRHGIGRTASGQPIFQSGVEVDHSLQPINVDDSRVYANVWAAGALLAHSDPILERSLEGIAIVTATVATESMLFQSNSNSLL